MHAVRPGVGDIHKESSGQFSLNVEVELLQVTILLDGVAGRGKVRLIENVLGDVRLRIPARNRNQSVRCTCAKGALACANNVGSSWRRQAACVLVQRCAWG